MPREDLKLPSSSLVAETVRILGSVNIAENVTICDYCVLGYHTTASQYVAPAVASDAQIGPYCILYSGCRLDENVTLEPYVSVGTNSTVGQGSRLLYRAQIHENVVIGQQSIVGGFVCDRAHIGNECRVFGSLIHKSKPPWGPWDEYVEESPVLDDGVFVGSGSLVIGSVRIGTGAYIAAGAIVTRDVAPGTLVMQTNETS